uniref:Choline/carnitine acyltransferase domain-containing protein n=1 Tax=Arcella intermedia TaxID=1963864 RepID=A0A6B2L0J9_9EUKA
MKPLPVPSLSETASKYLNSLKPILSQADYKRTEEIVADFIKPGGVGPDLHQRLVKRAADQAKVGKSWLQDWWLDVAYLRGRYPLPINLSCHLLVMDDYIDRTVYTQTQQAARMIVGSIQWKTMLDQGQIAPELQKKTKLCMNQYRTLFTSERVPRRDMDELVVVPASNTVVVLSENQIFSFELIERGTPLTLDEIDFQLRWIKEESRKKRAQFPFGIGEFTSLPREDWADIRNQLEKDPQNANLLSLIQKSVLVVSLDNNSPNCYNEQMYYTSAGIQDRWYDKITDFLVFENSKISVLLEHTPCDAPTVTYWVDNVIQSEFKLKRKFNHLASCNLSQPKAFHWNLPLEVAAKLPKAREAHMAVAKTKKYEMVIFPDWGVSEIQKLKASPDSFMQLSLQLAFYKMHKCIPATYESAQTRLFKNGRTEVVRTQSMEVLSFCETMENPQASLQSKYLKFRFAEAAHLKYISDAIVGKGCDRHLFGLRLIAKESGLPEHPIYSDAGYAAGSHHRLSTSSVPGKTLIGGFCNVVPDGYGCCYLNKEDKLCFSIVSETQSDPSSKVDAHLFAKALRESFNDIRSILLPPKSANL